MQARLYALCVTIPFHAALSGPPQLAARSEPAHCANQIEDEAAPGQCLAASSEPLLGALYPLSEDFYVSPQGSVGIGTTAPAARLDVAGSIILSGNGDIGAPSGSLGVDDLFFDGGTDFISGIYLPQMGSSDRLYIADGASIIASFHDGGSVGIGTPTPAARLDVAGSIVLSSNGDIGAPSSSLGVDDLYFDGGADFISGIYLPQMGSSDRLYIADGANVIASFHDGGSVGIGTATPGARLDVAGETATQTLRIRGGSDVVERFRSSGGTLECGAVVVLDPHCSGDVRASATPYDKKVIGVVSGAGGVNPGLVLSQEGVLDGDVQVAMVGRVNVLCSAENGPIEPGDRLTTSSLPGHAMKVTDSSLADGAVIGKAAGELREGTGLVLVVVNLQ